MLVSAVVDEGTAAQFRHVLTFDAKKAPLNSPHEIWLCAASRELALADGRANGFGYPADVLLILGG